MGRGRVGGELEEGVVGRMRTAEVWKGWSGSVLGWRSCSLSLQAWVKESVEAGVEEEVLEEREARATTFAIATSSTPTEATAVHPRTQHS